MSLSKLDGSMVKDSSVPSGALVSPPLASSRRIDTGGLATGGGDLTADRTINVPAASRAEAQAMAATNRAMTPERVKEAMALVNGITQRNVSGTLTLAEEGCLVEMNSASANSLYVPNNTNVAFTVDTVILVVQLGAGQTTIIPEAGVTIRSSGAKTKTYGQYSVLTLIKRGTNDWYLLGDLG